MELVDGDFDDSSFPEFLSGFAVDKVTGYVCALPFSPSADGTGAAAAVFSTRTEETPQVKLSKIVSAVAALSAIGAANAATDLTPITAAQTDALAVVAALVALGIAVWGANYVRTKFFR